MTVSSQTQYQQSLIVVFFTLDGCTPSIHCSDIGLLASVEQSKSKRVTPRPVHCIAKEKALLNLERTKTIQSAGVLLIGPSLL